MLKYYEIFTIISDKDIEILKELACNYSIANLNKYHLIVISGCSNEVMEIVKDYKIKVFEDREALNMLQTYYGRQVSLKDVNVCDNELDIVAVEMGLDPYSIRRSVQPNFRALPEQELKLLKQLCINLGIVLEKENLQAMRENRKHNQAIRQILKK